MPVGEDTPTRPAGANALLRERARSLHHPLTRTLLVLTFTAGLVDAACFLGLGRVFTANMTGNVVLLGFGVAGSAGLPVVAPVISLGAFMAGAFVGGWIASRLEDRNPEHLARTLAVETALEASAAVIAAAATVSVNSAAAYTVIALLAMAMGARSATVRRIAVPDLNTTVLTMTLTALASELPIFGGSPRGAVRRSSAVLSMFAGAVAGALLLRQSVALPIALAAALALAASVAYPLAERRTRTAGAG
jgi:uncharacterized membrane protein YoaK (UPF0700 family)